MKHQTKLKMSSGMILWAHLEQLRKDLELVFDSFDELYKYISHLKEERSDKLKGVSSSSQGR